jgi:hypothetical protein
VELREGLQVDSHLRVAVVRNEKLVAKARTVRGSQRKGIVCHCKPLPISAMKTENYGLIVIVVVICKV